MKIDIVHMFKPNIQQHSHPFRTGPTQASPEKASSEQYGFPADIWAFACTFIHAVSGYMPWEKRYSGCDRLEFIVRMFGRINQIEY